MSESKSGIVCVRLTMFVVGLPFICDFETDAVCDMQLSTASNLDWTRRIGRASEQDTGPPGAQSGSFRPGTPHHQTLVYHHPEHSLVATTCSSTPQSTLPPDTEPC